MSPGVFRFFTFFVSLMAVVAQETLFPVSIIHFNDMHARFDETNMMSNTCKASDDCIGGYARLVTKVKELRSAKADKNPIFLNAADNYQGTLWYNTFKWNVTSEMLNFFPADATTIGNHEFDDGVEGLVPYMERSLAPILISNVDDSLEPSFQGTYNKSMVMTKNGRQIGIVGVTTTFRSNWGNVNILPEVEAVRDEVAKLTADGVNIIIVLSHCGLEVDRDIAKHGGPIDIIVGGHSHSFLWSGANPPGPDSPVADYPTIERNENGDSVLIVQASAYTKYLGDITLWFNEAGVIERHEGAPIFLGHDVVKDPETVAKLAPWKEIVDRIQNRVVGKSKYDVPSYGCYSGECLMGSLAADAYVAAFLAIKPDNEGWTGAAISLAVPGGVRAGLTAGEIFYGDLITTTPFENALHSVELQGKVILEALEFSVANPNSTITLQVSGLKVVFDMKKDVNKRVVSLFALCRVCENNIPKYEPINAEKYYRVVMPSFLAGGGDGFTMIAAGARNPIVGPVDIDALTSYVERNSPLIMPAATGRIRFV